MRPLPCSYLTETIWSITPWHRVVRLLSRRSRRSHKALAVFVRCKGPHAAWHSSPLILSIKSLQHIAALCTQIPFNYGIYTPAECETWINNYRAAEANTASKCFHEAWESARSPQIRCKELMAGISSGAKIFAPERQLSVQSISFTGRTDTVAKSLLWLQEKKISYDVNRVISESSEVL